ncbi:hypothetical protein [Rickettsia endosymbiont of Cantharis rufa]|uniref:hypothetical protein n=1 Tax=Rickettsia endosymbiont of Cantharis rufa TaxID=3066248 RepID=UPI0031331EAD
MVNIGLICCMSKFSNLTILLNINSSFLVMFCMPINPLYHINSLLYSSSSGSPPRIAA